MGARAHDDGSWERVDGVESTFSADSRGVVGGVRRAS